MAVRKPRKREFPVEPSEQEREDGVDLPPNVVELTQKEAYELYDSRARELLGMSAEEFEAAWARGDFEGREEDRAFLKVWFTQAPRP